MIKTVKTNIGEIPIEEYRDIKASFWKGLRVGELLALTADDVKGDSIKVNKTYNESINKTWSALQSRLIQQEVC